MDEEINLGEISIDEDIIQIPSINIPLIKGEKGDTGAKGEDGQDYVITSADYQAIANIVEDEVDIPTKFSDLSNDIGLIDSTVNDLENYTTNSDLELLLNNKQDILTAGNNIIIEDNVISATGGGSGGTSDYSELTNKPKINNITLSGNKTSSDLGIQAITDNTLQTTNKTIPLAINEVNSIAKGANQALSYSNYSAMITEFNSLDDDVYNVGQNIYIVTTEVPDLWISNIESTSSTYTYTTDSAFISALSTNGYVQVGYYKVSMLETQKVDLSNYATKEEKADIINNTVTGNVANFIDGANYFANSLVINIEPVQSGSGTASPSNVRNITGWTGVTLNHSGEDTTNPTTKTISWQSEAGTIYGGVLNVTTGVLTKTKALLEFAVADMNNSDNYPGWKNTGVNEIIGNGLNKKFTAQLNIGNTFGTNTMGDASTLYLPKADYNNLTQTQFKTQYPNLVVQIVVEYAVPITYQLTPQQLEILSGENNIWADTGDVTVNYKADTKNYIDSNIPDLTNYVTNTNYATSSKGGVIKTSSNYGTSITNGVLYSTVKSYQDYTNSTYDGMFISKGTLENVIEGKKLLLNGMPIGAGCDYYGTTAPTNFMFADGSAISRTDYSELFDIIGTTYGSGDGSTTFNLPDKRERVSVMYKEGSTKGTTGATLGTLGAKGGEFKHTLAPEEIASHHHALDNNVLGSYWSSPLGYLSSTGDIPVGRINENNNITTGNSGANTSFNVLQPYLVCNYIIKVK